MASEILITFLMSIVAGIFGAILGLGGGVIIIPFLTLVQGVPIKIAIAASIVAVVATSTASAASYVEKRIANVRLGMLLETSTTSGALIGALIATSVPAPTLTLIFGIALIYAAFAMLRAPQDSRVGFNIGNQPQDRFRLASSYYDLSLTQSVEYAPRRIKGGILASLFAGWFSGMLGVGGGLIKVPVMNSLMKVPTKVATATSNFMIGITAATGAAVYFLRGFVNAEIVAPVALGVLLGAVLGSKISPRIRSVYIHYTFVIVLVYTAIRMILGALGISVGF